MNRVFFLFCCFAFSITLFVHSQENPKGGISPEILSQIKTYYKGTRSDVAIRNAVISGDIKTLSVNSENKNNFDSYFSHKVENNGITDQKSSGRCWLFTGLNVFRARIMHERDVKEFHFSHVYSFFWDQLEKSNLFLQAIIDTRKLKKNDEKITWLFKNPLSDGGQFTGVSDNLQKYGVVPFDVMMETKSSNNTRAMSTILKTQLREFGVRLREQAARGTKENELIKMKTEMLGTIYRILVFNLGEPPVSFTWTAYNKKGEPVETKEYTPQSFYQEYIGEDISNGYVMLMNDPSREFNKLYTIDYDRHLYDGKNWTYINLPIEEIKEIAIASIKDNRMMYFSCDVGKFLDRERGLLDIKNFDYASLFDINFTMNKKERIETFDSGSSHAMALMAVDLAADGKPKKWMVENSWGATNGHKGHLIMTDEWFNEYMFRLVVEKKFINEKIRNILKQKPIQLPAWDPMFANDF